MATQPVIETKGLTKYYGQQAAVDGLSLDVQQGEIFGFLGPNGAGKTTTILMLLGLTEPSRGEARVCGFNPTREPLKVKRLVGYLPENVGFYQDMSARENLRYVARLNDIPDEVSSQKIDEALGIVGLSEDAEKRVGIFSRGMSQRLGIAEVLIKDPRVCFLDEPTLGLDPDGAIRMIDLIARLSRERKITMLISSHNLDQVQKISHRVGIMIKGKLVALGPMEQLAKEKLGLGKQKYTLEQIYMKYFHEV
ncbi:MAG: ABC transporter ATP-binding protein [Candidatus Bathyarchaeota archaeon]|nr:ABC transporter ATP-binding protein [Candidatus Bathyarchaeota archaeon]